MNEIGVKEVREALLDVLCGYTGLCEQIIKTPDEQFLKTNLAFEYGLTSIEFQSMCDTLYIFYGIVVDLYGFHPLTKYPFEKEQTVENFIETVNYCLSLELKQKKQS